MCEVNPLPFQISRILMKANLNCGLPRWLSGRESPCQCWRHKRHGFDPWVEKILWRRKWQPLQYSCLDRGAWQTTVHEIAELGVTKWLSTHKFILQTFIEDLQFYSLSV